MLCLNSCLRPGGDYSYMPKVKFVIKKISEYICKIKFVTFTSRMLPNFPKFNLINKGSALLSLANKFFYNLRGHLKLLLGTHTVWFHAGPDRLTKTHFNYDIQGLTPTFPFIYLVFCPRKTLSTGSAKHSMGNLAFFLSLYLFLC